MSKKQQDQQNQEDVQTEDVMIADAQPDDQMAELESQIESLQSQVASAEDKYRRALADYQNLERQFEQQHLRYVKLATEEFVKQLIMPLNHLQLAAAHVKDKGLDMVITQFKQVLETNGLKEIEAEGKEFDPETMEVIDTKEGADGKVLQVVSPGYELNGIVVEHAKVVVGKKE